MSGHSKWSTIKRTKGANDAKRGAVFTKLGNQIAIAARGGTDPATNSALAMLVEKARSENMPSSNIQRSIDRVKDKNAAVLEESIYEAYGPGGVGLLIEIATDNKNRTLPEIKHILSKNGGSIAEPGSVSFQFDRRGVIHMAESGEAVLLQVIEAGADDATEEDDQTLVYCDPKQLGKVRQKITGQGLNIQEAGLEYIPKTLLAVSQEIQVKVLKLLDAIDENDDVVNVSCNADFQKTS